MTICGIMTGTSLDGIDVAVCRFSPARGRTRFELLGYREFPVPPEVKMMLEKIIGSKAGISEIARMNFALADLFAEAVKKACKDALIDISRVDAVGCHGQTVFHAPEEEPFLGIPTSATMQLCSLPALAERLGIKVIGDFRSADIAAGGQGAPLVPIFDYDFLRSETQNVAALNIGGMANITLIPKNAQTEDVIAFDTGPGNILTDIAARLFFDMPYDDRGRIARSATIIPELLEAMLETPFIEAPYPKSTGRELFNEEFLRKFKPEKYAADDLIATLTELTAQSIARNIGAIKIRPDVLFLSGGGAANTYLGERISAGLPNIQVRNIESAGIDPNAKEAICFAYLAYRRLRGLPGNLPSATGARKKCLLGAIADV